MKTFAIAGVAGLTVCQLASAASFTSVVGGSAWGGQNYINFDSSVAGANGVFSPAAGVTVTLTPDAQLVSGSVSGAYAAPYLSGDNNKYFEGSTPEGPDGTRYLTTGSTGPYPGASITFTFTTPQH